MDVSFRRFRPGDTPVKLCADVIGGEGLPRARRLIVAAGQIGARSAAPGMGTIPLGARRDAR
jgi:hypothetical protein